MILEKYKYAIVGLFIYAISLFYLHFSFHQPFGESLGIFLIIGIGLSSLAWVLTKNIVKPFDKPIIKKEVWLLVALIVWVVFYLTYGSSLYDKLFPQIWLNNSQATSSIIILLKRLFVFVIVPFSIYKFFGFTLKDFGLKCAEFRFPTKKTILVFVLLSIVILLIQFFLSSRSKPIRTGQFTMTQLVTTIPICFAYIIFNVGLIEEFFFRGLLQSRFSMLLKSSIGGIVCASLIFGLAHAPGLFLRGAVSEGIQEQMPFLFWAAYSIVKMSVAGVFLGIVYNKTKNLWLVMAIHAMVDLFPNFLEFVNTWHL